MRHFLHQEFGPHPSTLSCGVLACPLGRTLVGGTRAPQRLATAELGTLPRAVDLPVITCVADADLLLATPALEDPGALDQPDPGRSRFLDAGAVSSDSPPWSVASIPR
jgi:hypothetical protein